MLLSDDEERMYAGEQGLAVQKAMDLLVRYGEAPAGRDLNSA